MFKRFLLLMLALVLALTLVSCDSSDTEVVSEDASDSAEGTASPITPLLYKVTDEDGDVLWLFGSIHMGLDTFYPLPDYVMDAFEGADSLAVEFDIISFEKDMNAQASAMTSLVYSDGTTIKDHVSPELYERAVESMTDLKIYASVMDYYCPFMWASLIESALYQEQGLDVTMGVDRHLIKLADKQDKEILEIESAEMQYQLMASFSDDVQSLLLESAVQSAEYPTVAKGSVTQLMELWEAGDAEKLAKLLNSADASLTQEQKELYEEYNKAMVTDRNLGMLEFATDMLDSDKEVFLCVGAGHIVGEDGLVDLLEQQGYTVEIVPAK